jgi:hypothetical protein
MIRFGNAATFINQSSPLTTAEYQMEELDPILTDPITLAVGATNEPFITGCLAPNLTALRDGCTAALRKINSFNFCDVGNALTDTKNCHYVHFSI